MVIKTLGKMQHIDGLIRILGGWFADDPLDQACNDFEWNDILAIAWQTKTEGLLAEGLTKGGISAPPVFLDQLKAINANLVRSNLANFAWSLKISSIFQDAEVMAVIYKGATRAKAVYHEWGKRRSADIDVIVPKRDFDKAMEIVAAAGFQPMVNLDSRWWHDFLGEVPFQHPEASHLHIDLHQELQQPGGPYPKKLDSFFESSVVSRHSGKSIRHFSPAHELLVTVVSYGKAVRAGEPWLSYAHEIAYVHLSSSDEQRRAMAELAKANGLSRLYSEAVDHAFSLFDIEIRKTGAHTANRDLENIKLGAVGMYDRPRFFRGAKLWQWQDGPLDQRIAGFIRQQARVFQSDWTYRKEHTSASS